jgi:hypothetical protein
MQLFDDIKRTDLDLAAHAEPLFVYLSRSARAEITRLRDALESWFASYPAEHGAELRGNIRCGEDWQFRSAMFELVLHEVFRRMGCAVDVHPPVGRDGRHPDFLVTPPGTPPFILEVVQATNEPRWTEKANQRLELLWDEINKKLTSPDFWIAVEITGQPDHQPSAREIVDFLHEQFKTVDVDRLAAAERNDDRKAIPKWRVQVSAGCTLVFSPMSKAPEARGKPSNSPLALWMPEGGYFNDFLAIRQSLERKADYYGPLPHPYVIAINAFGQAVERGDITDALFGELKTTATFFPGKEEVKWGRRREPNGFWVSNTRARNRHVTAVLVARKLMLGMLGRATPRLYVNPWGERPPPEFLTRFPHTKVVGDHLEFVDGCRMGDVLGLSAGWPEEPVNDDQPAPSDRV